MIDCCKLLCYRPMLAEIVNEDTLCVFIWRAGDQKCCLKSMVISVLPVAAGDKNGMGRNNFILIFVFIL